MAVTAELGFGLKNVRLTPLPSGTIADLPRARSVDVNIVTESATLTGDDKTVAVHTFNIHVEGSFESGGMNPAAIAIMLGVSVTNVAGPPAKATISVTTATNPGYFKMEGQVLADDGGDFHFVIYKAKVTNGPNWTFSGGEFVLTSADYTGVGDSSNKVIDLVWNETITAIT